MRNALPDNQLTFISRAVLAACTSVVLLLNGCSSAPTQGSAEVVSTPSNPLAISQDALARGEFDKAEQALQPIEVQKLNQSDYIQYLMLNAQLQLKLLAPDLSKFYLDDLANIINQAPLAQQLEFSLLKAQYLEATNQFFAAAQLRDHQISALRGDQAEQNLSLLWQDLMQIPEPELQAWLEQRSGDQFGQWLALANIMRDSHLTLDEQLNQVALWQQQHPLHPGARTPPQELKRIKEFVQERPQQVALLLPLSGPLEKTGQALRNGFIAAYYDSLNKGFNVPKLYFYDSAKVDINNPYAQAQFDGVQWIVGPVEKNLVQSLQEREALPLPTLALNYSDRSEAAHHIANLYQFGLAAEDEAQQIAEKAWADGKRQALVLAPQGAWGERVYAAFEERWLALGGKISGQRFYPERRDYNPDVKALLNINDSQERFKTMRSLLQQSTEFEPRRRQDADWVFMIALPQPARQIKPTLAFNFAADLPVYATSHIYSGENNPSKDRDLNGIQFCDVPWLLQPSDLYNSVEKSTPHGQGSYARLYAMGADAFRLLPMLKLLENHPSGHVFGHTGALQLDSQGRIVRRTECTRFEQGRPVRLSAR